MAKENETNNEIRRDSEGWITYRPEIKVLDCTIRDGGLMNDHLFDDKVAKAIYQACVDAGVDYMELGYKADKKIFAQNKFGIWKFCTESDIRKVIGDNDTTLKLATMADAEKCNYKNDILPREESVFDLIRVATYIHQIPIALDMIKDATDKGYETSVNLMAISTVPEYELDVAIETLAKSEVGTIYLVDSFGSLYGEQMQYLARKYLKAAKAMGKEVGVHTHNNQELAYSNTITSLIEGVNYLDATIDGMGRGAGNCQLELLLGFLHNPKYRLRPILKCLTDHIRPLKANLNWGFQIPYMLTGLLNQHPRSAMKFLAGDNKDDFLQFYDEITEENS
ncbi:MAG: aldolase catalytic domain-containing protein [Spirochaetales bacterium]|nr:aldolase catalytic domain-containing protein [Spirochaetales bacterium]